MQSLTGIMAIILACIMGFATGFGLFTDAYDTPDRREVRTERFILVDKQGQPRLEITVGDTGPYIRLWDVQKEHFVDVYVDDPGKAYGVKVWDAKSDIRLERTWR